MLKWWCRILRYLGIAVKLHPFPPNLRISTGVKNGEHVHRFPVNFKDDDVRACLRFGFRGKKRQFFDETRRENGRLANPDNYREPDHFSNEVSSKKGRFFTGS